MVARYTRRIWEQVKDGREIPFVRFVNYDELWEHHRALSHPSLYGFNHTNADQRIRVDGVVSFGVYHLWSNPYTAHRLKCLIKKFQPVR
jgi:hypothetical protein